MSSAPTLYRDVSSQVVLIIIQLDAVKHRESTIDD